MSGFLSFIAKQYGRKAEDVATDVLAYLLLRPDSQRALCQLLTDMGYPHLKPGFSVEIRTAGEGGRTGGIPDIWLSYGQGERKVIKAIIEDKFGAALTTHQPCTYLDRVEDGGIVLFVAPAWRQKGIWEEIRARCEKSGAPVVALEITSSRRIGERGLKYIAVISWNTMLRALPSSSSKELETSSSISEVELFVDQLRRLCDVEDTSKFEKLSGLISERDVASSVYSSMTLLQRIIESADADGLFTPDKPQYWQGKNDGSCGPGYFGYYGSLGTKFRTWIGFDARLWSERGESPVWIEFDDKTILDRLSAIFLAERGRFPWLDEPTRLEDGNAGNRQLVISVPLRTGVELDALLALAVERIEQVKEVLDSRQMKRS
jgi:hypothetical protein